VYFKKDLLEVVALRLYSEQDNCCKARERDRERVFTMSFPVGTGIPVHSSVACPETAAANQDNPAKHTDVRMGIEGSLGQKTGCGRGDIKFFASSTIVVTSQVVGSFHRYGTKSRNVTKSHFITKATMPFEFEDTNYWRK
jgi:hypothetical protein